MAPPAAEREVGRRCRAMQGQRVDLQEHRDAVVLDELRDGPLASEDLREQPRARLPQSRGPRHLPIAQAKTLEQDERDRLEVDGPGSVFGRARAQQPVGAPFHLDPAEQLLRRPQPDGAALGARGFTGAVRVRRMAGFAEQADQISDGAQLAGGCSGWRGCTALAMSQARVLDTRQA